MSDGKVGREFLARIPIFGGLAPEVLDQIIEAAAIVEVAPAVQLIAEGELATSVFVVCQGELEIRKRGTHGKEFRLAVLKSGDCVGEMSLIDIQPRSATVCTLTPTVLFRLDHSDIGKLYRSHPEVYTLLVMNIAREISRRLRRADQVLADMGLVIQELWSSPSVPDARAS
jgi:CRP/FNR family cyclic AMP-dependent transcriptional regulator